MLLNNDNDYNLLNKKSQPGAPVMSLIAHACIFDAFGCENQLNVNTSDTEKHKG